MGLAELLPATLVSYDEVAGRAIVELRDSPGVWLRDVAVSAGLPAGELLPGRQAVVWLSGPGDSPAEALLIAVWG